MIPGHVEGVPWSRCLYPTLDFQALSTILCARRSRVCDAEAADESETPRAVAPTTQGVAVESAITKYVVVLLFWIVLIATDTQWENAALSL